MFRRVPISESRTPTFALVITRKTAKARGLTIPSAVRVLGEAEGGREGRGQESVAREGGAPA